MEEKKVYCIMCTEIYGNECVQGIPVGYIQGENEAKEYCNRMNMAVSFASDPQKFDYFYQEVKVTLKVPSRNWVYLVVFTGGPENDGYISFCGEYEEGKPTNTVEEKYYNSNTDYEFTDYFVRVVVDKLTNDDSSDVIEDKARQVLMEYLSE